MQREKWFNSHVGRSVGNGKQIYFWWDVWVGGVSFREKFIRLFELAMDKWVSVFDMCQLGWGENREAWKWRRRLFAWKKEKVRELCLLLRNVTLQVDKEDRWLWNFEKSSAYSLHSAYNFQSAQPVVDTPIDVNMLWQKHIPLKVVVFVWRLFHNRLPTKDNLLRRNVLDNNSCLCASGCGL